MTWKPEEIIAYLRSDFKNVAILVLLVAVAVLAKDNKDLSLQIIQIEKDIAQSAKNDAIQERLRTNDYSNLAHQQQEFLNVIKQMDYEKNNNSNTNSNTNNKTLFNPERKEGY